MREQFNALLNQVLARPSLISSRLFNAEVDALTGQLRAVPVAQVGSIGLDVACLTIVEQLLQIFRIQNGRSVDPGSLHQLHNEVLTLLEDIASTRFGYTVQPLEAMLAADVRDHVTTFIRENATGEIGIIDAVGDGNCGPRAVIQSLLIQGLVTGQAGFVSDFLQGIYDRRGDQRDELGRSLYGCVVRRMPRLPDDLMRHSNSCILIGEVLHYIDFDRQAHLLPLRDINQFKEEIQRIGGFRRFEEFQPNTPIRVSYEEINACLVDGTDTMNHGQERTQQTMRLFLSTYAESTYEALPNLRGDFFGVDNSSILPRFDHIIYVLAGCLRFDINAHLHLHNESYESGVGLGATYGDEFLGQLEREMDPQVALLYFASHGINSREYGAVLDFRDEDAVVSARPNPLRQISPDPAMLEMFPQAAPPANARITIDIFRPGGHFMTLVRENTDSLRAAERRVNGTVVDQEATPTTLPQDVPRGSLVPGKIQVPIPAQKPAQKQPVLVSSVTHSPSKNKTNYSFLMAVMAHQVTKALSIVLFVAGLLLMGVVVAGHLPLAAGVVIAGLALISGIGLFAGSRSASKRTTEDDLKDTLASPLI